MYTFMALRAMEMVEMALRKNDPPKKKVVKSLEQSNMHKKSWFQSAISREMLKPE